MVQDFELDDAVHQAISGFCEGGDDLAERGLYDQALVEYNKAWALLPEPQSDWEASTWILAAIADAHFLMGNHVTARQALEYAMTCPDALGNPFLHLRLGQVLHEVGDLDGAADQLMRAYMGAGAEVFETEDEKYLAFLKTRARLG